jgi:hypothetical protein
MSSKPSTQSKANLKQNVQNKIPKFAQKEKKRREKREIEKKSKMNSPASI